MEATAGRARGGGGRFGLPGRALQPDRALMRRLARWHAPRWVRRGTVYASRSGDGWAWLAVGVAILLFGGQPRWDAFASASLAAGLGVLCFVGLKTWVRRPRPTAVPPGVESTGRHWSCAHYRDQYSFPSGHTLTAFAVVTALLAFYPEWGLWLLLVAVGIGASRLLLGQHFLSDVLAGGLLGAGLGHLSVLVLR